MSEFLLPGCECRTNCEQFQTVEMTPSAGGEPRLHLCPGTSILILVMHRKLKWRLESTGTEIIYDDDQLLVLNKPSLRCRITSRLRAVIRTASFNFIFPTVIACSTIWVNSDSVRLGGNTFAPSATARIVARKSSMECLT